MQSVLMMTYEEEVNELMATLGRESRDINYLHDEIMKRIRSRVSSKKIKALLIKQFGAKTLP